MCMKQYLNWNLNNKLSTENFQLINSIDHKAGDVHLQKHMLETKWAYALSSGSTGKPSTEVHYTAND